MRSARLFCLGILAVILVAPAARATVVRPDGTGDYPNIQVAVDTVSPGSVIELTDGVFRGAGNRDIDFHGKVVTVQSQNGPTNCTINPEGDPLVGHRGFSFGSGEGQGSVVDGITITGGCAVCGGAILIDHASPWIKNCVIARNESGLEHTGGAGGGACCGTASSPRFTNCSFTENVATSDSDPSGLGLGGGVYCGSSTALFENCRFSRNVARDGGGIYCNGAAATFTGCMITGSELWSIPSHGGGFYCAGTPPTITGCTICGNKAQYGGAIFLSSSSPAITSTTFYGNGSDYADIECAYSSPHISNTVITAEVWTQPIYCDDESSSPTLTCCDLYGNPGGDWTGCIASQSGSNGNISADPVFCNPICDPVNGSFTINANSPCAPAANPSCGLIGAWPVGCGAVPVLESTWGAIKARFK